MEKHNDNNNNIFLNANFGDKFKTKNGKKALLIYTDKEIPTDYVSTLMVIEGECTMRYYFNNGIIATSNNHNLDIISIWNDDK